MAKEVPVEGVVIRSDSRNQRVKLHRPEFAEVNRKQFGQQPAEADSSESYLVVTYCTPIRIRKVVRTMGLEDGYEFGLHSNDGLHKRVVKDMWAEHCQELIRFDEAFTPVEIYLLIAKRCIAELQKMQTNAELDDTTPTDLWQQLS